MDGFELMVVNGIDLFYEGWVELIFNFIEDDFDYIVISVVFDC